MRKFYPAFLIVLVSCISTTTTQSVSEIEKPQLSTEEMKLYDLIMSYRKQYGLPRIPLSKSLTYVAQQHCLDLSTNRIDSRNGCNAHSWSGKGKWSKCCYTPDHKNSKCMWDKPRELTNYEANGYEIAYTYGIDPNESIATAELALAGWKSSKGHNNVIVNREKWKYTSWNAIGIGIYKGYVTVWFGETPDKEGEPSLLL